MSGPLRVALVGLNSPGYNSLALGYLRAYAEAHPKLRGRVAFQTIDLDVNTDPWWVAYRIAAMGPDVVGFSVTCWNARNVYETCRLLRRTTPDVRLLLGGPEVGPIAEDVLAQNPSVDAIVRGEGEETFSELLVALSSRARPWRVEGVTARRDHEIVSADDRPLIRDLDSIPSPYLSGAMRPGNGSSYLETYRGCPHRCGYCYEGKGYGRVRHFSRQRVEAEVAWLVQEARQSVFSFIDPVFNLTDDRLRWLSDLLAPHASTGLKLHTIEVDIERIGPDEARLLKRAGVVSVETGPQSVGEAALEVCRRHLDPDRFRRGVEACKAEGISVECDLILGLPGDDPERFLEGMRFVLSTDPGKVQLSTLHVLPGTDLWQRSEELGLLFDTVPPHEIISSAEASFHDLRRAEVMGLALQREYEARI